VDVKQWLLCLLTYGSKAQKKHRIAYRDHGMFRDFGILDEVYGGVFAKKKRVPPV
jgi:hypothetical protein